MIFCCFVLQDTKLLITVLKLAYKGNRHSEMIVKNVDAKQDAVIQPRRTFNCRGW